jgi:hypothetical protein
MGALMTDAPPDWAELRRLAEAARDDRPFTMPAYRNASKPEHILALLDRAEKAEAEAARLREALRPFAMGEYAIPDRDMASETFLHGCGIPYPDQPTTADHRRARDLTGGDDA